MIAFIAALAAATAQPQFAKPDVIRWGARTVELQQALKPLCPKMRTRKIDPPFLDGVRTEQLQIDCDGFTFFGRGRHVEFVIRDDRLVMVWLMVEASEAAAFGRAMRQAYGQPTSSNGGYVAFERNRAAWRHKPPEILFYSSEIEAEATSWFR